MLTSTDYYRSPTGLVLPERFMEFEARRAIRPKAMEFFAGAGGMAVGHIEAGHEVVAVAEWDVDATITLMANLCRYNEHKLHFVEPSDENRFEAGLHRLWKAQGLKVKNGYVVGDPALLTKPLTQAGSGWIKGQPRHVPGVSHVFFGDVRKLTSKRILDTIGMKPGDLDLISGGPPCQGFSKAGKQNVMDPRNSLVFEFARFIVDLKPSAIIMEEVPEIGTMVTPDGDIVLDKFIKILSDGGFGAYDALQKSVGAKTGNMGIVRGRPDKPRKRAAQAKPSAPQDDLFSS